MLKNGWRMNEIDEMDILGFLSVRAWALKREKDKKAVEEAAPLYIDEVWRSLTP